MRILHVNKFLYRRGGAEIYMLDLASAQRRAGHEVEHFGMRHPENLPSRFEDAFPSHVAFEPPPLTLQGKLRGAGRLLWSSSAAAGMGSVLRAFRPDLVHLHNIYHQLSPSILRPIRAAGIPAVMTLHDYKLACPTYQFLDHGRICEACVPHRFWSPALRRCNGGSLAASALNGLELTVHTLAGVYGSVQLFACPSRFIEGKMRESRVFPDRLRWIPNFVDVDAIAPKGTPGGNVIYAGRLAHEKGVDVLIEAAALDSRLRVDVAGEGPERRKLERLAEDRSVTDRVRFHGPLPSDRLRDLLRSSAVLALPARWYENMPLVVLEAFAAGLPVVGTSLGGLAELIEPASTGLVIPPDDPEALADALGRLVVSPVEAFEMGRTAREKAEREFTPTRHLSRLEKIYEEAARAAAVLEMR